MYIKSDAVISQVNVGIGTASPDLELHVHDANNSTSGIILSSTSGYHRFYEASGQLYFQSGTAASADSRADINFTSMYASTTYMKILGSNGNVGVGIASPTTKLDVGGVIKANGTNSGVWVSGDGSIYRNYSGGSGAGIHLTGNAVIPANSSGTPNNSGVDFGTQTYRWARVNTKIGYYLDDYNGSSVSQWFGKRYGNQDSILSGMEIQNLEITSGATYSQRVHIRSHRHGVSHGRRMTIHEEGRVGVGTEIPYATLHVRGSFNENISSSNRTYMRHSSAGLARDTGGWGGTTILGEGNILATSYILSHGGTINASDERIKKSIVDADDMECLETLRLLKPKKYQYKDVVKRGEEPVWGFIAQEVKETLPHATQLRQDVLPNIYELANVSSSNVITFTNFNTSNLESNATTLIRLFGPDNEDHDVHLAEIIDAHSIRVEEDLTKWTGSVDDEGNVITEITTTTITPEEYEALETDDKADCVANITGYQNANVSISVEEYNALEDTTGYEQVVQDYTKTSTTRVGNQLFVYGQEVDDFVFLKKEAIWTVATAALQEVDRQLQAEKSKTTALETKLQEAEAKTTTLETKLQTETAALETELQAEKTKTTTLETKLQEAEAKIATLQAEKEAIRSDLSSLVLRVAALES
jgi:hypothetical protein